MRGEETQHLTGTGTENRGGHRCPLRTDGPQRIPLLLGALERIPGYGPSGQDPVHQPGPPFSRTQHPPCLLLSNPPDPVGHIHPLRNGRRPAQSPQRHPRVRRQPLTRRRNARSKQRQLGPAPVPADHPGGHRLHQRGQPAHPLTQRGSVQHLARNGIQAPERRRGCARHPACLPLTQRDLPPHTHTPRHRLRATVRSSDPHTERAQPDKVTQHHKNPYSTQENQTNPTTARDPSRSGVRATG